MKIAIPSDDQRTVCQHFGKAAGFVVVEVSQGQRGEAAWRPRQTELVQLGAAPSHADHHTSLAEALADCQVVLVGGIGAPMVAALQQAGLRVFRAVDAEVLAAVDRFLSPDASALAEPECPPEDGACGCGCHHEH